MKNDFKHFFQNNSLLQVPYKNDLVTSIISTNVRSVLNYSFGSRTELVQNAYDMSCTVNHDTTI